MFIIFIIFHLLVYLESFNLYKKGLRKRSSILVITNSVLLFLNSLKFYNTFHLSIPVLNFLAEEIHLHPISNLLWILLNFINIGNVIYVLNYAEKKGKQQELLKELLDLNVTILLLIFIILLFSQHANMAILVAIGVISYKLIKEYQKKKKNYLIVTLILLGLFSWYSYFTYTGAARLTILLKGYIKEAYDTGLEEIKYYEEKNSKKFSSIQSLKLQNGEMGIIEVKNYVFIKLATLNIENAKN